MRSFYLLLLMLVFTWPGLDSVSAQQRYTMPDVSNLKSLTTQMTDRAPDIPGKETTMTFYSGTNGDIITIYSFRGRNVGFSTHNNSDIQKTYRLFVDFTGERLFQEIPPGSSWTLPAWAR
jgi:hypothetical protein